MKDKKSLLLGRYFLLSEAQKEVREKLISEIKTKQDKGKSCDILSLRNKRAQVGNFSSIKKVDGLITKQDLEEKKCSKHILQESVEELFGRISEIFFNLFRNWSRAKAWNFSMVLAVFFGMFVMAEIHTHLGQSASAKIETVASENIKEEPKGDVLGTEDVNAQIDVAFITKLLGNSLAMDESSSDFEKRVREMVAGYPIEVMVPEIVKKDRMTASFIIAIAKKESNWGKRVPVLDGQDCFNYWGYRGIRDRMGTGGHTCFDSPKDAVDTVAKRIDKLIKKENLNTPEKIVVWKCGYDCSWDSKAAIQKWISDVEMYFKKLN